MNTHRKSFVVAAPIDKECLLLVNYIFSVKRSRWSKNCENCNSFPSNVLPYTVFAAHTNILDIALLQYKVGVPLFELTQCSLNSSILALCWCLHKYIRT